MELFGFKIEKADKKEEEKNLQGIVPDTKLDGATEVASTQGAGGIYGQYGASYVDLEGTAKSEADLVTRYRNMSLQAECDQAIEDIINQSVVLDGKEPPVDLSLDKLKVSAGLKKKIKEEFDNILTMLDFGNRGHEIYRRWYVDGRIYYQIVIDEKKPREGIKQLRYIDPRKIRKIRKQQKKRDKKSGATLYTGAEEFYYFNASGFLSNNSQGIKIAPGSICHIGSGLVDATNKLSLGYLHKAIKPLNQLRMLEDALVIYRLSRAPERRIFYIDVGNLPKMKAEQYLRDMMIKHKNKTVYDASTGEIRDDRKFMTMLEDFWLPRREGGRGTEITTLPGGQNLGEMDDVEYFKKKLYKALNVPIGRMESEQNFNIGRTSEITRDELKFTKFVYRLRNKFCELFDSLLETQLILKGIATSADFQEMKNDFMFDFASDSHFEELKHSELMTERLRLLGEVDPLVGKYFSTHWIRKNVLRMTDEDIESMKEEMEQEAAENPEDQELEQQAADETQPSGNTDPEPVQQEEEFKPNPVMSEEEKNLVKRMTKLMEDTATDFAEGKDE